MKVFNPFENEELKLKNRIVRSATAKAMAENGYVKEDLIELYKKLTKGGAGMIVTGYTFVSDDGKAMPKMTGISRDDYLEDLKRLVSEVKRWIKMSILLHKSHMRVGRRLFRLQLPLLLSSIPQ